MDLDLNFGAVFGFYGTSSGPNTAYDWFTFGPETGSMYGASVNSAGDIDQDGFGDVIIGAYLFGISDPDFPDQPDEGAAYIFQGSQAGIETQYSWRTLAIKQMRTLDFRSVQLVILMVMVQMM